jgi:uncharacterized membrane protein YoaK (UPF0700 family)
LKTLERDGLLLLLAVASGSADGWSFFGMGHAFVANMTGNTVLLGISVFHVNGDVIHPLIALAGYFAGTVVGTLLNRRVQPGVVWAKSVSWTIFLEAVLLTAAEAVWVSTRQGRSPQLLEALLGCVALAIGLQSGAMVQLRIPGVVTTYISGTWTTLTSGLTLLISRQPRVMGDRTRFEERFELQGAVLGVYFLSAVVTGWAFRNVPLGVGAISAAAVLLVAAYSALRT